jgi:ankyrin repeat protein
MEQITAATRAVSLTTRTTTLPSSAMEPVLSSYLHAWFGRGIRDPNGNGQTPLMEAVANSDEASVFMLLQYHVIHRNDRDNTTPPVEGIKDDEEWVNAKNTNGQTALHLAATRGKPFSLGAGEDLHHHHHGKGYYHLRQSTILESFFPEQQECGCTTTQDSYSSSSSSCRPRRPLRPGPYESIVDLLLEHSANYEERERNNLTPLHIAIYCGAQLIARRLILAGADVNCLGGPMDYTPLHVAVEKNNEAMVHLLLETIGAGGGGSGADISAKCKGGLTALHMATGDGLEPIVQLLLAHGADCSARDCADETPLHHAAQRSTTTIAQLLINQEADLHAIDSTGSTPLHHAVWKGSRSCVELLLNQGANVHQGNKQGDTALHWAAWFNDVPMGQQLLRHGAAINGTNIDGLTPIQRTRDLKGVDSFVRMLIQHGADIHWKDHHVGRSALLFAAEDGCIASVRALLEAGANVQDNDIHGYTSLHYAAKGGYCRIAALLLQHGEDVTDKRNLDGKTALELTVGCSWEAEFRKVVKDAVQKASTTRAATEDLSPTTLSKKQKL